MGFKEIAAYSLGLFGFQAIVGLLNSYQAEFDASILGADIAVVGILVLVAKILSAVFDPIKEPAEAEGGHRYHQHKVGQGVLALRLEQQVIEKPA